MSIDYTKHRDKRVNNPTIEHRDFFVREERRPYNTLYPRDPSLDPRLVWKGKGSPGGHAKGEAAIR
jgi:adenine-specific DNA-methyltransferase